MSNTWRWLRVIAPGVILLPIIFACVTRPIEDKPPATIAEKPELYPQSIEKDIDLLFVIDNSNSMGEEQDNLMGNFPKLIESLRTPKLDNKIPNVRIGVVSSDLGIGNFSGVQTCDRVGGDDGRLRTGANTCLNPDDPWIEYIDGKTNISAGNEPDPIKKVQAAFQCVANLGVGGCGFEHQLESARRALDPALDKNPGFLRDDAYLAIIFITDEDDCSAVKQQLFDPTQNGLGDPLGPMNSYRCSEFGYVCDQKMGRQPGSRKTCKPGQDWLYKVEDYANFFAKLKPEGRLIMFAIAGPHFMSGDENGSAKQLATLEIGLEGGNPSLKPSCLSNNGKAVPAIRMEAVVDSPILISKGHKGYFNGISAKQRAQDAAAGKVTEGVDKKNIVNICSEDFGPALKLLGEVIVASLGGQCLTLPPLTKDGGIACYPGINLGNRACEQNCLDQVECTVRQITKQGTASEENKGVEKCPVEMFDPKQTVWSGADPCWRIIPNSECTPEKQGTPFGLQIMRPGNAPADKGTVAKVTCSASPYKWGSEDFTKLPECLPK